MSGAFTRYGPVEELLAHEDDRYMIMNAGDELTVRFNASRLPPLPAGWRRDYVLYTDGWVKDADLHTAFSQSVEPLPYHGMPAYTAAESRGFPVPKEELLTRVHTRKTTDKLFRDALRQPDSFLIYLQELDLSEQRAWSSP